MLCEELFRWYPTRRSMAWAWRGVAEQSQSPTVEQLYWNGPEAWIDSGLSEVA